MKGYLIRDNIVKPSLNDDKILKIFVYFKFIISHLLLIPIDFQEISSIQKCGITQHKYLILQIR